jgi:threonine dehydrogenase-like Zn-dependent dehydrogenase
MRAVRCGSGRVRVVDVPEPTGDGVRVRVRSAGICGSDLHLVGGGFPVAGTLGHEFAGELADGTAVAVEPLEPCGSCPPCTAGDYHLCRVGPAMLLGVGRDGGMAEEVLVPQRALVPLPRGLALRDASLVEPLAVALHGLRKAGLRGGTRVAVVGAGTIGLCATAIAVDAGADVTLVARHDHQREAGERLGARVGEPEPDSDLVVEAAGSPAALERAVTLCRPGGSVVLVATYWDGKLELPAFATCLREITIVPSSLYGRTGAERDVDLAATLLARRPEIAATLITHRFPLDAAVEAFACAAARSAGAIKVVLEP